MRQTVEPPTVKVPKVPLFAFNCVVEAMPLTNKFVVLTLVAVVFWRLVPPSTVNVLVTVELAPTNPP